MLEFEYAASSGPHLSRYWKTGDAMLKAFL
jgi:hypothetical protein